MDLMGPINETKFYFFQLVLFQLVIWIWWIWMDQSMKPNFITVDLYYSELFTKMV